MTKITPSIFVFCALACEARPLIRRWRLKKLPQKHPFTIYADEARVVVISGIGKTAMAGAVGYALAWFSHARQPLMLNFGIAGHACHSLGSVYLADKILALDTGKHFYPQLPFTAPCPTSPVATLTQPTTDYAGNVLYEMEAAAFYEMALKFSSCELVHCLKVVSDNSLFPAENINESSVEHWCEQQLEVVDALLEQLSQLKQSLPPSEPREYEQLLKQYRFTATSAVKLKALLARWDLVMAEAPLSADHIRSGSGKELIVWMEKQLGKAAFYL